MYCNYCGKVIQDDASHCAYCGKAYRSVIARHRLVRPRAGRKIAGSVPGSRNTLILTRAWSGWCGCW